MSIVSGEVIPRLDNIPSFHACFVASDLEDVASYFRGLCHHMLANEYGLRYEVSGKGAVIEQPCFGPELDNYPNVDWLADIFPLRGYARISRVRSNPRFTMIEMAMNRFPDFHFEETFHEWTGADTYRIWSSISKDPCNQTPTRINMPVSEIAHGLFYYGPGVGRWLACTKNSTGYKFHNRGPLLSFENPDHYQKRYLRDRLNRNIICEYLEALGIDPEATFDRRELDDPILYTADHIGNTAAKYTDEGQRYEAFRERCKMLTPTELLRLAGNR